jgi:dTDP-4-dehydrorhamnose reductase
MKILITGANGLLGQSLTARLLEQGHQVLGTGRGVARYAADNEQSYSYADVDITDGVAIEDLIISSAPEIIVHAAAMTNVDQCELNKSDCYNSNVGATRFIIDAAKVVRAKLIYVSTDFIFDGEAGPYAEDAEPAPVNYYGSTKLIAENAVKESGLQWAIARTILVYGVAPTTGRTNIVSWVKQSLEDSKPIKMVTDQWRTPTFVHDLADGIVLIIEKNVTGIFHLSGEEMMTPYELAVSAAKFFKLDEKLIGEAHSPEIKQPATRPAKTGFVIDKAKKVLGYAPVSFQEGLKQIFAERV